MGPMFPVIGVIYGDDQRCQLKNVIYIFKGLHICFVSGKKYRLYQIVNIKKLFRIWQMPRTSKRKLPLEVILLPICTLLQITMGIFQKNVMIQIKCNELCEFISSEVSLNHIGLLSCTSSFCQRHWTWFSGLATPLPGSSVRLSFYPACTCKWLNQRVAWQPKRQEIVKNAIPFFSVSSVSDTDP